MKKLLFVLLFFSLIGLRAPAQAPLDNADQVVDKISARERALVESFKDYIPIAETYLQELALRGNTAVVVHDHYFLSQAKLGPDVDILPFKGTRKGSPITHFAKSMFSVKMEYLPEGFAQMVHPDVDGFDRDHYSFNYLQRDLLGEVDCLVFDVLPLGKYAKKKGMFEGRIWVEDHDYTIVRYKGFFRGGNDFHGHYFHFDTSRVKTGPGVWLPAAVYTEEKDYPYNKISPRTALAHARFKAQTRFWGYEPPSFGREPELTQPKPRSTSVPFKPPGFLGVTDVMADYPLETQAEDNVTNRLESLGLLAPPGEWDGVLKTIARKLETANHFHIQPQVRCRELLTTRMEFFTVGHTIIVSRGLLDVAADEATLAAILALGLAKIELMTPADTRYPFADQVIFNPEDTFRKLSFVSASGSIKKIRELAAYYLSESPYKDSIPSVREFFAELVAKSSHIPELVVANLGDSLLNQMIFPDSKREPAKEETVRQAALPLGSRTRVDPWTDQLEILSVPPTVTLANDPMPFEVTPSLPYQRQRKVTSKFDAPSRANPLSND